MSEETKEATEIKTEEAIEEKEEKEEEETFALTSTTSPAIVLDNGGGILKCGLSNSAHPYCVQSLVGTPKHSRVMFSSPSSNKYFGNLAYKYRGLCKLTYPIQNGIIQNWNDMIQLWQHLFQNILNLNDNNNQLSNHPILITETARNPMKNRIRMTQIYLEYFNTPSIYFIAPNILALYATGRLSGCVLDSGFGVTTCVPIIDGYSIPNAINRMNIGGSDITKYLSVLLSKCGDYNFQTSAELQTVRIIKEKECILSVNEIDRRMNPSYDSFGIMGGLFNQHNQNSYSNQNLLSNKLSSLSGKLGSSFQTLGLHSKSAGSLSSRLAGHNQSHHNDDNSPQYTLPDGTIVNIGNTHERAAEILFNPSIIGYTKERGLQYLILNSIQKCDMKVRHKLYDSIYLTGGNCNIKNFSQRLSNELKQKVMSKKNKQNVRIRPHISKRSNQKHLIPYIGGTLLASNQQFKDLWITQEQFNEYGANILFRRALC